MAARRALQWSRARTWLVSASSRSCSSSGSDLAWRESPRHMSPWSLNRLNLSRYAHRIIFWKPLRNPNFGSQALNPNRLWLVSVSALCMIFCACYLEIEREHGIFWCCYVNPFDCRVDWLLRWTPEWAVSLSCGLVHYGSKLVQSLCSCISSLMVLTWSKIVGWMFIGMHLEFHFIWTMS